MYVRKFLEDEHVLGVTLKKLNVSIEAVDIVELVNRFEDNTLGL